MIEKTTDFNKDDSEKLTSGRKRRESGMVYAEVNGASGFFHISEIPIKELGGKTVIEYIKETRELFIKKDKQIEVLKEVLQETRNELKTLKGKVETYVV